MAKRSALWACEGKFAFDTPGHARKVAKRMRGRDKNAHAFRCEHCERWHIGHMLKPRAPKPRRPRFERDRDDLWGDA